MTYRWADVDSDVSDDDRATFIGSIGLADLWLTHQSGVLVCQYEGDDNYVSYYPAGAVYDDMLGIANPSTGDIAADIAAGNRVHWKGSSEVRDYHDPKSIATYVAVFAPDLLTEEQRAALLVSGLTQKEE